LVATTDLCGTGLWGPVSIFHTERASGKKGTSAQVGVRKKLYGEKRKKERET